METEKKKRRGNKRSRGFNPNEDELSVIEALIRFCEIHKKINSKQTQFLSSDSLSTAFTSWGIKRRRSVVENPPLPSPPLQSQPRSLNIPPVPIPPVIEKESKITSPVSPLIFSTCPGGGDSNQKSKSLPLTLKRSSPPLDKQGRREREKSKRISKKGIEKFKKAAQDAQGKMLSGQDAFVLCDTYGFPLDLTELMAAERGLTVDVKGFNAAMDEARERSRSAQNQQVGGAIAMDANATASLHQRGISPTDDSSKFICNKKKKELENVDIELTKENALLKKSIQKKMYESQQLKAENSMLENKKRKLLILWSSEKEAKEKDESPTVKKKGKEHAKLELQTFNNGCPQLSARQEEEEQLLGRYYHDYDQRQLLSRYYYVYEKKQQQRQQEVKKFQKCNSKTTVDGKEPKKENSSEKDEQNKQGISTGGIDLNQLPDDDGGGENIYSTDVTNGNNVDLRMSLDTDNKRRGIGGLISLDAFEKAEMEKRMRSISIQAACKANREERMRKNREKKMKVARMQPVMIAKQ